MSKLILTDASVTVNSVNLSAWVDSVELTYTYDDVDVTTMGATAKQHSLGLRDDTITINFVQDYAAGAVHATLHPLVGNTGFSVVVKPTSQATSTTNPSFTATCVMFEYQPLSGSVGDRSDNSVTFQPIGAIVMGTT